MPVRDVNLVDLHLALQFHRFVSNRVSRLLPGLLLCLGATGAAMILERIEAAAFGATWLEALVLAILIGTAVRAVWSPGQRWFAGINFSAKTLLEIAVLLGASISAGMIVAAGPLLTAGIAGIVVVAIAAYYRIGRAFGLPHRMSMLVACGNSICGNSAIAAVAPIIGADGDDVAASIAFTAVLDVLVVLGLPLLPGLLHLTGMQYGVLAGLTVYAVPQVLAAMAPIGAVAVHIGTLVKLVRVLMLEPVVLGLSLLTRRMRDETDEAAPHIIAGDRPAPDRWAQSKATCSRPCSSAPAARKTSASDTPVHSALPIALDAQRSPAVGRTRCRSARWLPAHCKVAMTVRAANRCRNSCSDRVSGVPTRPLTRSRCAAGSITGMSPWLRT